MYLTARRNADELNLELSGAWRAPRFTDIEAELGTLDFAGLRRVNIAAGQAQLDLTGAWLLRDVLGRPARPFNFRASSPRRCCWSKAARPAILPRTPTASNGPIRLRRSRAS